MTEIRLHVLLSRAGFASRRKAEALIKDGRVAVNGEVIQTLGAKADPDKDDVSVDGVSVGARQPPTTLVLNKPVEVVTTLSDPEDRETVADLVSSEPYRFLPVGRLDYHTEGLLLMTTDGELSHRLLHPRYHVPKVYQVKVRGRPAVEALGRLREGVPLEDGPTRPAVVELIEEGPRWTWLEIVVAEGRNRLVRRMCDEVGHPALRVVRTELATIGLGGLKPGQFRYLQPAELTALYKTAQLTAPEDMPERATAAQNLVLGAPRRGKGALPGEQDRRQAQRDAVARASGRRPGRGEARPSREGAYGPGNDRPERGRRGHSAGGSAGGWSEPMRARADSRGEGRGGADRRDRRDGPRRGGDDRREGQGFGRDRRYDRAGHPSEDRRDRRRRDDGDTRRGGRDRPDRWRDDRGGRPDDRRSAGRRPRDHEEARDGRPSRRVSEGDRGGRSGGWGRDPGRGQRDDRDRRGGAQGYDRRGGARGDTDDRDQRRGDRRRDDHRDPRRGGDGGRGGHRSDGRWGDTRDNRGRHQSDGRWGGGRHRSDGRWNDRDRGESFDGRRSGRDGGRGGEGRGFQSRESDGPRADRPDRDGRGRPDGRSGGRGAGRSSGRGAPRGRGRGGEGRGGRPRTAGRTGRSSGRGAGRSGRPRSGGGPRRR